MVPHKHLLAKLEAYSVNGRDFNELMLFIYGKQGVIVYWSFTEAARYRLETFENNCFKIDYLSQ